MARPVATTVAEELYAALVPFNENTPGMDGAATNWALLNYCSAIAKMLDSIAGYVRDTTDGKPGYSSLLDLSRIPSEALDWAAQFIGVSTLPGSSDADKRTRIANTDGFKRGTVAAMKAALAATLTGTKTVRVRERYDGTGVDAAYYMQFASRTSETPDAVAALAALVAQKPDGIILSFVNATSQDWTQLIANNATWNAVTTRYATWNAVLAEPVA